jgi:hypothetical protein
MDALLYKEASDTAATNLIIFIVLILAVTPF